jgi:Tol biopolymer transport system component
MKIINRYLSILLLLLFSTASIGVPFSAESNHFGEHDKENKEEKKDENDDNSAAEVEDNEDKDLPLKADRRLTFEASEGSWMSLDISPDGKQIVFDLLGDLYTLPIGGGTATQITDGMAMDMQPRFSPDGKKIVYVSDKSGSENVWTLDVTDPSAEPEALTSDPDANFQTPEWSLDGQYIVVGKSVGLFATHKLWMYHIDGGNGLQLIDKPEQLKTTSPAFGKNNRYIWFEARNGDWNYNAQFPQVQLARYDRDTGKFNTMTNRYGSAMRPVVSPGGKYLVYATRYDHQTGLVKRDLMTGEEQWLAYPVQRDEQESRATMGTMPGYAFTPDSKKLLASYGGKFWSIEINSGVQTNIPFKAQVDIGIGAKVAFDYPISDDPSFDARQIRHPALSPNGKKLAFTSLDRLYVMDYPKGKPQRVTSENVGEYMPAWSPNNRWLSYVTWDSEKGGHINRVRPKAKSKPRRLTQQSAVYRNVVWSNDGKRIVAEKGAARELKDATGFYAFEQFAEFVWLPSNGGATTSIMPTEGMFHPHFTQDSKRIYAYGENGLISFRWDGSDQKTHLKVVGKKDARQKTAPPASLVVMAPKGDQALALQNNQLYSITVPWVGGKTPTVNTSSYKGAGLPVRKLSKIAADFPFWSGDGKTIRWSLANALFSYDLDQAKAFDDKRKAEEKAEKKKKEQLAAEEKKNSTDKDTDKVADAGDDGKDQESNDNNKQKDSKDETEKDEKPEEFEATEQRIIVKAKRDIPSGQLLLKGARIITMKGKEIFESGDILIENNRIKAVGKSGSLDAPKNVEQLDLVGKTIVPGYIDVHYHSMWLIPELHGKQVWQYMATMAYGVTTTRDPQTSTTDVLSYADRVESGQMVGPRIYSTGPGVFWTEPLTSYEDAKNALTRYSDYYDTKTFKMYMTGQRKQRQWLIKASKELQLMPTTEGGLDIRIDLTHAIDGYPGVEHNLPVFPLYSDVVNLYKFANTTNTPTLLVDYGGPWGENYYFSTENVYDNAKLRNFMPYQELASRSLRRSAWFHKDEYAFPHHAKFTRDLVEAGGSAGVGSHGQIQGIGFHWELWAMQSGGMSNHDTLRTATILGANAIGFGKELGSIVPGKLADLVILDKNPLDNIRHSEAINRIMKNGRLYGGKELDEQWPSQKPRPQSSWSNSAPKVKAGITQ